MKIISAYKYLLLTLVLKWLIVKLCIISASPAYSKDYQVSGIVRDMSGQPVPNASVAMRSGSFTYSAVTSYNGTYSLKIPAQANSAGDLLFTGTPYPVPFTNSVSIPVAVTTTGDIYFAVYSITGKLVASLSFTSIVEGSYRIIWDGMNGSGSPVKEGFYVYAITFRGITRSGRLIKAQGYSTFSASSGIEQVPALPLPASQPGGSRVPVITTVTGSRYYDIRLTDIIIGRDTVIDFTMKERDPLPFKTESDHIAMNTGAGYRPLILKGVNLGSSPPGTFPGEIAYAISPEMYRKWIGRIASAGFNSIRVYTLHPPVFYETLANYNNRHPENPLLLFQGIWLDEIEDGSVSNEYDLVKRIPSFLSGIKEVTDCIHGKKSIPFRPGRAYGNYLTDVSQYTAGFIIGREIITQEVDSTDYFNSSLTSYSGSRFSITGASASEVFAARMLDETAKYELNEYETERPVSISSWPTLDPLIHPTEIHTDEDKCNIDIYKISGKNNGGGIFATYHAYPYYPNFVSQQPEYQSYSDTDGNNSYLGYLNDLKNHYPDIPLVIGEFGVPSSWGSAHQSFSNMDHGGYSEIQQGEKNLRMMHNILDAGCAGGFMFSWMDEWFKATWIVGYLEAFGFQSGDVTIPTRQLWHNVVSPEQNFGLISFDQNDLLPFIQYQTNNPSGPVTRVEATNDNAFFYLNLSFSQNPVSGDTILVAFDTYSGSLGESVVPDGVSLTNRSEFYLSIVAGEDTVSYYVTEAYDMKGFTPRFNLSDPAKQKYRSTVTDGSPWKLMEWINDGFELTRHKIGKLPMESSPGFSDGTRSAAALSGNSIKIRIPWTLLHFYDPTQMKVINGASTTDGGATYRITPASSEGIAVSVIRNGIVTSSTTRYNWNRWLVAPVCTEREKSSLQVVAAGLSEIPGFAD